MILGVHLMEIRPFHRCGMDRCEKKTITRQDQRAGVTNRD